MGGNLSSFHVLNLIMDFQNILFGSCKRRPFAFSPTMLENCTSTSQQQPLQLHSLGHRLYTNTLASSATQELKKNQPTKAH